MILYGDSRRHSNYNLHAQLYYLSNRKSSTNYVITGGFRHAEYMDTYTIL